MVNSNTQNTHRQKPVVLAIAGHDPSGGAGIQADIESIANAGCHAVTIITSLTVQDSVKVTDVLPQDTDTFQQQLQTILEDMDINACKIGMIGSNALLEVICNTLSGTNFPIVVDPVLAPASGKTFTNDEIRKKIMDELLPIASITTPNSIEARSLSNKKDLNDAAQTLLTAGSDAVLITGTHEDSEDVTNTLYRRNSYPAEYHWQRLPDTYHGSGCTLSSRIAARLALGDELIPSVEEAQNYTWNALQQGFKPGHGQAFPDHFYNLSYSKQDFE